MTPPRRENLGRFHNGGYERNFVYLIENGLEIDVIEGYQIQRVRVFFDDVTMISMHLRRPQVLPWLSGIAAGFVFFICFSVLLNMPSQGESMLEQFGRFVGVSLFFLPFFAIFLVSLRSRLCVTVHGNRSKASMQWTWQHAKGEVVYNRLSKLIGQYQQSKRERIAHDQAESAAAFAPPPLEVALTPLSLADPPASIAAQPPSAVPAAPAANTSAPTASMDDINSDGK